MQTRVGGNAPDLFAREKRWLSGAFVFAVFLLTCLCSPVTAATYTARVIAISDGDTLTVRDQHNVQHRIRLAGIDAPEKHQPWGQRSRRALADKVYDRMVEVEIGKQDRYGRQVGKVLLGGEDVNLALVRLGLAWHYKAYEREQSPQDRLAYARAEQQARDRRQGLWRDAGAVPPWEFRKAGRPPPPRAHVAESPQP